MTRTSRRVAYRFGVRQVGERAFEAVDREKRVDYHVREEGGEWYVDAFASRKNDANAAHLNTEVFPTFGEAWDFIFGGGP